MTGRNWIVAWVVALVVLAAGIVAWESVFVALGGNKVPVTDNLHLWTKWRDRATSSQPGDLVLVGASRMQLDVDLAVLEQVTGKQAYQLAIDGTSPLPVLFNLAIDSRVRGDIIVSLRAPDLTGQGTDRAKDFVDYYHYWDASAFLSPAEYTERLLKDDFFALFPSRALGVRPESLYTLWKGNRRISNYLTTFPTREREADYSLINAPALRKARFARSVQWYRNSANVDRENVNRTIEQIRHAVQLIRARGSNVIFVQFPVSDELLQASREYLPDAEYLGLLERKTGAPFIRFHDYPSLQGFHLPDGSHLDRRDQEAFTEKLAEILVEKSGQ